MNGVRDRVEEHPHPSPEEQVMEALVRTPLKIRAELMGTVKSQACSEVVAVVDMSSIQPVVVVVVPSQWMLMVP